MAKDWISSLENHINKMFLAGVILGSICSFSRSDYNLPMFAFFLMMFVRDDVRNLFLMHFRMIN